MTKSKQLSYNIIILSSIHSGSYMHLYQKAVSC